MALNVYVRDAALHRVALLEDFGQLDVTAQFNDVGAWQVQLHRGLPAARMLNEPGAGIEVVHDGVTVLSGPATGRKHERSNRANTLTVSGLDDMVWLRRRIAHMQPTSAGPPYNTQSHDVRTGRCSTVLRQYVDVNAGPGAIIPRRVPGLAIGADPLVGTTVTGRARLQVLLELLQELALAGGQLGFRLRQVGAALQFEVYAPVDRSAAVKFSEDFGNLAGYSYESAAPDATYVYVGGGGEGTARTFLEREGADRARWGRIELFRDRRDTVDTVELGQTADEELTSKAEAVSLTIAPVDTAGQRYGVDYGLGDRVTVVVDGVPVVERIRQVQLTYTPQGALQVRPQIGTPGRQDLLGLFRAFRGLRSRVTNIERR
jgi:hypothetical protein